jgi:FKBP-type peptidyl-prolyl cis-trans isomerase
MLKKSAILVTSLMLGLNISQADDAVKKPVVEEVKKAGENEKATAEVKTGKYSIPEKKIEEFSKEDVMNAGSYLRGVMVASELSKEKDIDAKEFGKSIENRVKDPTLVVDPALWQKLINQYQEARKAGGEIPADLKTNLSRNAGLNFANKFAQDGFNLKYFVDGLNEKLANKDFDIPENKKKEIIEKIQGLLTEASKLAGEKAKVASKAFLEENKKKEGVVTLPSGLQYKIIKKGEGITGVDGQSVKVHYAGTTIDGKEFDNSIKRGEPFEVVLPGEVIAGWQEVLKLMNKGSKWQVFIPENLAYGEAGAGSDILPFSALIFEMEIIDISKATVAEAAPAQAKNSGESMKEMGKKFLEENKKKEGVVTLPSGLQYKIIKKGEGATGIDGQSIKVHYAGTTIEGKEFDSSIKRGQPFEVVLPGQVIKGWQEVLKLMNKGSKWQVFIPENLAYGSAAPGADIKPFSPLIFEMEIMDISK